MYLELSSQIHGRPQSLLSDYLEPLKNKENYKTFVYYETRKRVGGQGCFLLIDKVRGQDLYMSVGAMKD
jgi:hypothetical protein